MTYHSSIETAAGFDTRALRHALGAYATGIAVVTTCSPEGIWVGMTINSFSSVSLDPPLVLWSLALDSPSCALFENATHYAVNVLAADQTEVSQQFASRVPDKFAGLDIKPGISGVPLLAGCCAWFECRSEAKYPGGDHLILVGHVERFAATKETRPIIFHGGRYRELA
jgi:flavin reductase (DIM6/NTAB) family NADH-FMN oxidoreductase RutF